MANNNGYFPEGSAARTAGYFVPVLGSYLSVEDAVNNPSWGNISAAGLSLGGGFTIYIWSRKCSQNC